MKTTINITHPSKDQKPAVNRPRPNLGGWEFGTAEGNIRWSLVFGCVVGLLTFLALYAQYGFK